MGVSYSTSGWEMALTLGRYNTTGRLVCLPKSILGFSLYPLLLHTRPRPVRRPADCLRFTIVSFSQIHSHQKFLSSLRPGTLVAIDGKSMDGSTDHANYLGQVLITL